MSRVRRIVVAALVALTWAQPALADLRADARAQVEFGITVAQKGLWKEALLRWERATQIDPAYAAAYNNLAVAYEQMGQIEKARQAYEKAVELEPSNDLIRQNYDLFKEINDRKTGRTDR
jgi:Flp pilus assembly protein TadD